MVQISGLGEFRLLLRRILHMIPQSSPTIRNRPRTGSTRSRHLHQILIEPIFLQLLQLLLPLHRTRPTLQTRPLNLGLSNYDFGFLFLFAKGWKRIGEGFEICDEFLIRSPALFSRRFFDLVDECGVLYGSLVPFGCGEERGRCGCC